jgi:mannose-1-phosphate guanylyltransferase
MVLAAGLGTRLRPLTDLRAKALVPVGDRPALAHVLDRLAAAGSTRVVVNAHHRADEVQAFVRRRGPGVFVSEEPELLGTAGGLARAAGLLGEHGDVIVWNADILADVDPIALVAAHAGTGNGATLVVQPRDRGEGPVGLDRDGRVVRLRRERFAEEFCGGEFIGLQIIGASLRAHLPERGCLVADVYIPAMSRGVRLQAFAWAAPFFDVGDARRYLEANLAWLAHRGASRWIGEGARVAPGVALEQSLLGEGASVEGTGMLDRCVVWPAAAAVAPLSNAIVADGCVLRLGPC